jgi:hypothetical protein
MAPSLKDALDRYLQAHTGIDLSAFVLDRREQTPPKSWQSIAVEIARVTDGIFEISHETLRTWAADWERAAA